MTQETNPPPKRVPYPILAVALIPAVALLISLSNTRKDQEQLQQEITSLSAKNESLNKSLLELNKQLKTLESAVSTAKIQSRKKADIAPRTVTSKPAEPETLLLQPPKVVSSNQGLNVRLVFEPIEQELPEMIALVVRLPATSNSKIYALQATDESSFSNVKTRVDGSGKFAIFQGAPEDIKALQFELAVTAPVTATIRGSKGIRAFELDITPDFPVVRKL